jgi:uncharacterized OB-fold protein
MKQRAVESDLFETGPSGPRLVGGRRKSDGKIVFPFPAGRERSLYDRTLLGSRGALWSWTVQRFRPKTPPYAARDSEADFRPFVVGYVEIPGEIIVETRVDADPEELSIGQPMEMTTVPFTTDADGTVVLTYAFRPVSAPTTQE